MVNLFVRAGKAGYAPRSIDGSATLASVAVAAAGSGNFASVAVSSAAGTPLQECVVFTATEAGSMTAAEAILIGAFVTVRCAITSPSAVTTPPRRSVTDALMAGARGGPASWRTPARRPGSRADDRLHNYLCDSWLQSAGLGFAAASAIKGGEGCQLVAAVRRALLYIAPYRARFKLQQQWLAAMDAAPRSPNHHGGRTVPCDQQKLLDLAADINAWASVATELKHEVWSAGAEMVASLSSALAAGAADLQHAAERMQACRRSLLPAKLLQRDCQVSRRAPQAPANAAARSVATLLNKLGPFAPVAITAPMVPGPALDERARDARARFLRRLCHPDTEVCVLVHYEGGRREARTFAWLSPASDCERETNDARCVLRVSELIATHATREQDKQLRLKIGLVATLTPVVWRHIRRALLPGVAATAQNAAVEQADRDLAHHVAVGGSVSAFRDHRSDITSDGTAFGPFFTELEVTMRESFEGADERRTAAAAGETRPHTPTPVTLASVYRDTVARIAPGTAVPSPEYVRLQFMPSHPCNKTAARSLGIFAVKRGRQARQMRKFHLHAHYAAALYKYMREWVAEAVRDGEAITLDGPGTSGSDDGDDGSSGNGGGGDVPALYSPPGLLASRHDAVQMGDADLARFADGAWLNDNCIDAATKFAHAEELPESFRPLVYIVSCMQLGLCFPGGVADVVKLERTFGYVRLQSKLLICVSVHQHAHYSTGLLVRADVLGPWSAVHGDSIAGQHPTGEVLGPLCSYLNGGSGGECRPVNVPQQPNGHDCAIYSQLVIRCALLWVARAGGAPSRFSEFVHSTCFAHADAVAWRPQMRNTLQTAATLPPRHALPHQHVQFASGGGLYACGAGAVGDGGVDAARLAVLKQRCTDAGLCVVNIDCDGNCCPAAVAHQLNATHHQGCNGWTLVDVRRLAALHIRDHWQMFVGFAGDDDCDTCVRKAATAGEWVDELFLTAAAHALHVHFTIITSYADPAPLRIGDAGTELVLGFIHEQHYSSTTPCEQSLPIADAPLGLPMDGATAAGAPAPHTPDRPKQQRQDMGSGNARPRQRLKHPQCSVNEQSSRSYGSPAPPGDSDDIDAPPADGAAHRAYEAAARGNSAPKKLFCTENPVSESLRSGLREDFVGRTVQKDFAVQGGTTDAPHPMATFSGHVTAHNARNQEYTVSWDDSTETSESRRSVLEMLVPLAAAPDSAEFTATAAGLVLLPCTRGSDSMYRCVAIAAGGAATWRSMRWEAHMQLCGQPLHYGGGTAGHTQSVAEPGGAATYIALQALADHRGQAFFVSSGSAPPHSVVPRGAEQPGMPPVSLTLGAGGWQLMVATTFVAAGRHRDGTLVLWDGGAKPVLCTVASADGHGLHTLTTPSGNRVSGVPGAELSPWQPGQCGEAALAASHAPAGAAAAAMRAMLAAPVVFVGQDDKAKVPVGPPGEPLAAVHGGKRGLVPEGEQPSAMDHDQQGEGKIIPSVTMFPEVSSDPSATLFSGTICVALHEDDTEPSSAMMHGAQLAHELGLRRARAADHTHAAAGGDGTASPELQRACTVPVIVLQVDGGADHNWSGASGRVQNKLALVALLLATGADRVVAYRNAGGHSFMNAAERAMGILNLALVGTAHDCDALPAAAAAAMPGSRKERRAHMAASPPLRVAWREKFTRPIQEIARRFELLELGGERVNVMDTVTAADVLQFSSVLCALDKQWVPGMAVSGRHAADVLGTAGCAQLLALLDDTAHVNETQYVFDIHKCDDPHCRWALQLGCGKPASRACSARKKPVPLPRLDPTNKGHYLPYSAASKLEPSECDLPRSGAQVDKQEHARKMAAASAADRASNLHPVRGTKRFNTNTAAAARITCGTCGKPRVVYALSGAKGAAARGAEVAALLDNELCEGWQCGDPFPARNRSSTPLYAVKQQVECSSSIEDSYHHLCKSRTAWPALCSHCGTPSNLAGTDDLIAAGCAQGGRQHRPICRSCLSAGRKATFSGRAVQQRAPARPVAGQPLPERGALAALAACLPGDAVVFHHVNLMETQGFLQGRDTHSEKELRSQGSAGTCDTCGQGGRLTGCDFCTRLFHSGCWLSHAAVPADARVACHHCWAQAVAAAKCALSKEGQR